MEFIEELRERQLPPERRHAYYQTFCALVALRPAAEQDALVQSGESIWHYRRETARHDIDVLRAAEASSGTRRGCARPHAERTKISPTVWSDTLLADVIFDPAEQYRVRFAVCDITSGTVHIEDRVQVGPVMYMPPQTRLVPPDYRLLRFPTGTEEFGDEQQLLGRLRAFLTHEVALPDSDGWWYDAFAMYAMMTWLFDRFDEVPYLHALGPFSAAKTRLIMAVGDLCFRTLRTSAATTTSPFFRMLDRFRGTAVLDEADLREDDDYFRLLRLGTSRATGVIMRAEPNAGGRFDSEGYGCFGPKILATRHRIPDDALESRCVRYTASLLRPPVGFPLVTEQEAEAQTLRNQLQLWRFRRLQQPLDTRIRMTARPDPPRVQQLLGILRSVFASNAAVTAIIDRVASAMSETSVVTRRESLEGRIVRHMVMLYQRDGQLGQVTAEIAEALNTGLPLTDRSRVTVDAVGKKLGGPLRCEHAEFGHHNTRGYRWGLEKLRDLATAYGIQWPTASLTPSRADQPRQRRAM